MSFFIFTNPVSANYLKGVVDAQLRVIVSDELDDNDQGLCTNKFGMCEEHAENIHLRIPDKKQNEAVPLDDRGICTNKFQMCELDAEDVIFGSYISQNRKHNVKKHGVLGALDMGGSSTQIVYRHTSDRSNRRDETIGAKSSEDDLMMDIPSHLKDEEFFSISYLSYGADQVRVRLWDLWISETQEKESGKSDSLSAHDEPIVILNPCSFVGYQMIFKGYNLLGTGNSILCAEQVNRLIPHHDNVIDLDELYDDNIESIKEQEEANDKMVGGIKHPPLSGKYMAMSLYFFTLDCLRELSDKEHPINVHWPTPTIDELKHALESFCARSWKDDLEEVQHEAHEYTMAEILPHRCLEAVYMVTLLADGFGFHPSKRDITFTHKVDGNEVEWSLGLALSEYAVEKKE